MRADGFEIDIYSEPPYEDFWLINFLADGDLTKHSLILNSPRFWAFAIADQKIKSNKEMERRLKRK